MTTTPQTATARPGVDRPIPHTQIGPPWIGNLLALRFDRLRVMRKAAEVPGGICTMKFLRDEGVIITSAPMAHEVLVARAAEFRKHVVYEILRETMGNGLLLSERETHRRHRRMIAPGLQHQRIASYADTMAWCTEQAVARWTPGATFDLAEEMMRITLRIVGKTLFSADVESEAAQMGRALTALNRHATSLISMPFDLPTPERLRARRALAYIDGVIHRIIQERRASGEDVGDVLSMLLLAEEEGSGARMDDRQIRDEAVTLFLAGHETTSTALAWTFYLLGRHPHVYEALEREVDSVLGGRTPRADDLKQMPYTLQVLKEAMRLYPPAYAVGRQAERDLDLDGYRIRKGQNVLINTLHIHRRPDYFPDPERFDPRRFERDAEQRLPRGAYLPFGGGPRVCIGNHFALMEGQIILATVIQRRKIALASAIPVEPEMLVTLRPRGAILARARPREASAAPAAGLKKAG